MHGHDPLIDMRLGGRRPDAVYIDAGAKTTASVDWPRAHPNFAFLSVTPGEKLNRLDLRCVVGLMVQVTSEDPVQLKNLVQRCVDEGAGRVIGVLTRHDRWKCEVIEVTDTQGELTWHKS